MKATIIRLHETDSTNNYLARHANDYDNDDRHDDDIVVVTAGHQTAGRGQGTNTWESEDGKNLLFSLMVKHTGVEADKQFVLSMAAALALRDAIGKRIEDAETSNAAKGKTTDKPASNAAGDITLKWPNDIYWRDYKISGTLIETVIGGKTVKQCIFGTGINVNQTRFISDAPNPTSLKLITGQNHSAESLLDDILQAFAAYYSMVRDKQYAAIAAMYRNALYRRNGMHPYRDKDGLFYAAIKDVALDGTLTLQTANGELRKYMFKKVAFVSEM